MLAEPVGERSELALLELRVQVGHVRVDLLPKLARDDVTEGVGREVADRADRPVHVLEDTERVVRRLDAEVVLHALVPDLRQLVEIDRVGKQLLLELEAKDDVQVVRRLVGLNPDQGRLDPVDGPIPVGDLDAAERLRERALELRVEVPPERKAAADHVLPHAALRLVQAERGAMRERCAFELRSDAVLVQAVSALVHRPKEPIEVVLEVARGQPDVAGCDRGRERMNCSIEAPFGGVEAEPVDHFQLELLLTLDREADAAERTLSLGAGRRSQRDLLLLDPVEHGSHLGRLHAGLEVVEQHVVRLVVVVEALDVPPTEVEVGAQGRQELREVRVLSRLDPDGHRERRGARHLAAQLGGHAARLLPVATDEPDQARLVRVVRLRLLEAGELVEQAPHLVRGKGLVGDPVDGRQLFGADAGTAGRHLHLLVPAEKGRRAVEILDLADALLELGEGGLHLGNVADGGGKAGRRGSSEDDLPLRVPRSDADGGRGLNPPADEHRPAS